MSGAGSTATVSHAAPSSSATICGSAVQTPCPVSACGTATITRPSRPILMKAPNACSPALTGSSLEMAARPQRISDDQADPGPAADQQRPAVAGFNARTAPSGRDGRSCRCRAAAAARPKKIIRAGILNAASCAVEEGAQAGLVELLVRLDVDDRHRHLAEPLVGHAEHRHFGDRRAGVAGRLDLGGGDVLAAADDDVLLAVDDEQITVLVEIADVAGADVAVGGEQRLGRLRVAPIALDVGRRCGSRFRRARRAADARRRRRGSRPRRTAFAAGPVDAGLAA